MTKDYDILVFRNRPPDPDLLVDWADDPMVIDTETTGLNVRGRRDGAVWLGLLPTAEPNKVLVIHRSQFEPEFMEWLSKQRLIGHNLRFDLHALDLVPKVDYYDTMIAKYNRNTSGRKSLDHLAAVNGWPKIKTPDALKCGNISSIPEDELAQYLADDCWITYKLWQQETHPSGYATDCRTDRAVYAMERRGVRLIYSNLTAVREKVEDEIKFKGYELRNLGFNGEVNSPKQVGEWLVREGRDLPKTEKGNVSTSKLVLQRMADGGDVLCETVLSLRKVLKLKSAFLEPLPSHVVRDGILYPQTNTTRTKTGRFSCDTPNLQQIPKHGEFGKAMRSCFTSPFNDGVVACDFSQIELRVAAALAGEDTLLHAFAMDRCPHTEVAAKMFGKGNMDAVTKEERFKAKAVNFGILNGMGAKRLANELKSSYDTAKKFLYDYRRNLPRLTEWMEGIWTEVESTGVAKTIAGRPRFFGGHEDTRSAVSVVVQGTAAELMRHALVQVEEYGCKPFLTVHDEILCGQSNVKAYELQELMETAANGAWRDKLGEVEFKATADEGETWGDV